MDERGRADRRLRADPEDREAAWRALQDRRRRGADPDEALAPLRDLASWVASPARQDLAIEELDRRLGNDLQHIDTRVYEAGGARHRIASFYHLWTGIELQLIPGDAAAETPPFLIGRFPLRFIEGKERFWYPYSGVDQRLPLTLREVRTMAYGFETLAGFRLPYEDEWRRAAAAGTSTPYYFGPEPRLSSLICAENSSGDPADPLERVDQANAFGLVDVLGNVRELAQHRNAPLDLSAVRDFDRAERQAWIDEDRRPGADETVLMCGGSARDPAADCRVDAVRPTAWWRLDDGDALWGLRLARSIA